MTKKTKVILGTSGAIVVLMLATNPDQASHLRTITETAALKPHPFQASAPITAWLGLVTYNNYFLFSTTTLMDGLVTWGLLGKVYTTNRISNPL